MKQIRFSALLIKLYQIYKREQRFVIIDCLKTRKEFFNLFVVGIFY